MLHMFKCKNNNNNVETYSEDHGVTMISSVIILNYTVFYLKVGTFNQIFKL